jgi:hypothetical protein
MAGGEWRVAGGFARRVDDQPGVVAELQKPVGQQPQISVPKKLIFTADQVRKEQNL